MRLFLDRENIEWGTAWELAIETGLEGSGILLAILSPRYFASRNCRGELQAFLDKADGMEEQRLVLPLEYIEVPGLKSESANDELMRRVGQIQIEQWGETRFCDYESGEYRRRINLLANKIAEANAALDKRYQERVAVCASDPNKMHIEETEDEQVAAMEDGLFDNLEKYLETMEKATDILNGLSDNINQIGEIAVANTERIEQTQKRGGKPAAFLAIFKRMSQELDPLAQDLESGCNNYYQQISSINPQVKSIINHFEQFENAHFDNLEGELTTFKGQILFINSSAQCALESVRGMSESISGAEGFSRDLNAPLKTIRSALRTFEDATNIIDGWARLCEVAK